MCNTIKTLATVNSGELSFCKSCKLFHLIFNNLFFALNREELERLKIYIERLEIEYWEHKYTCTNLRRKIPLPTTQENLMIMLNRQEIRELKTLLSFDEIDKKESIDFLNVDDIDYNLILN